MAKGGLKVFGHLLREIVKPKLCVFCGACIGVCPVHVIGVRNDYPALTGRCILCQLCYYQCPKVESNIEELETLTSIIGTGKTMIGNYRYAYTARARDESIRSKSASGGVVTALLKFALEEGLVDCSVVAVADAETGWKPEPKVAVEVEEVLEAMGSKYTYCPMLAGLSSAYFDHMRSSIAFVGVPCQVEAVRRMQFSEMGHLKLGSAVRYAVGLFCMENFDYSLISELLPSRGVKPENVAKFDISAGRFRVYGFDGRELLSVKIKELKGYSRPGCMVCQDLTARFADISVGSIGSEPGMSTVLVRTGRGEELFNDAVKGGFIEARKLEDNGIDLLERLALRKYKRALREKKRIKGG